MIVDVAHTRRWGIYNPLDELESVVQVTHFMHCMLKVCSTFQSQCHVFTSVQGLTVLHGLRVAHRVWHFSTHTSSLYADLEIGY